MSVLPADHWIPACLDSCHGSRVFQRHCTSGGFVAICYLLAAADGRIPQLFQGAEVQKKRWNRTMGGTSPWHSRHKLGGEFSEAPVVSEQIQGWGYAASAEAPSVDAWRMVESGRPFSSHAGRNGVPTGGNHLFEDGHVTWYKASEIGLGSLAHGGASPDRGMLCFYKVRLE